MKLLSLLGVCSVVAADPRSFPSAWWSGSSLLSGEKRYITDSVSTDDLVAAFSKDSNLLLSHTERPEVVALVVCDQLKNDDFLSIGAMKSLESVISKSKSSVLLPQVAAGEKTVEDLLSASATHFGSSSAIWSIGKSADETKQHFNSLKKFLAAAKGIFSNGKTDFLVVDLPVEDADKILNRLDIALNELTAGKYVAAVVSKIAPHLADGMSASAPTGRKLLGVEASALPTTVGLRITPAIMLGLILFFVIFIILYVGLCGMMEFGEQDQFWPPTKADRPLQGKVET